MEMASTEASEFEGRRVQIQICAPAYALPHICIGYIYCPQGRRLLDHLNDIFPGTVPEYNNFLSVTGVQMCSVRGQTETVSFACLNKANIIFVRESQDGQTRGLGGKLGPKRYPYVPKSSVAVKLYLPFYTLTGIMHCVRDERPSDTLNLALRFLPLTNVEISPSAGGGESKVGFVAVNREQIILLEELGPCQSGQ